MNKDRIINILSGIYTNKLPMHPFSTSYCLYTYQYVTMFDQNNFGTQSLLQSVYLFIALHYI